MYNRKILTCFLFYMNFQKMSTVFVDIQQIRYYNFKKYKKVGQ